MGMNTLTIDCSNYSNVLLKSRSASKFCRTEKTRLIIVARYTDEF